MDRKEKVRRETPAASFFRGAIQTMALPNAIACITILMRVHYYINGVAISQQGAVLRPKNYTADLRLRQVLGNEISLEQYSASWERQKIFFSADGSVFTQNNCHTRQFFLQLAT